MFNWLKKKKQEDEGIEYSFIWYKKLESGNKTFYTQPFRTKVKAKSFEEAKEKATKFALGKMKLVIVSEDGFDKTDLSKFEKGFDDIYKQMDELFKNFKR
jgi:hypothetical protein